MIDFVLPRMGYRDVPRCRKDFASSHNSFSLAFVPGEFFVSRKHIVSFWHSHFTGRFDVKMSIVA